MNNPNITFFLGMVHSPLVGERSIINGHSIYNALLRSGKFNPKDIKKVSFGISRNIPIPIDNFNIKFIKIQEEPKILKNKKQKNSDNILNNITKNGYSGFIDLRSNQHILTNYLYDYSNIQFDVIRPIYGRELIHYIHHFVFYIIWENKLPDIDFQWFEFSLGKERNIGFGYTRIEKYLNINMEEILEDVPDKYKSTIRNGIEGIYNHKKYGFGEYIITETNNKVPIIKLITPLCLKTSIPKCGVYGSLPSFIDKQSEYTTIDYPIWHKGEKHILECVDNGLVRGINI